MTVTLGILALLEAKAGKGDELAAFLDGKAQASCTLQEAQPMDVLVRIVAIAIAAAFRLQEVNVLVVADGPRGYSGLFGELADAHFIFHSACTTLTLTSK